MSEDKNVSMTNPNVRRFYDGSFIGKAILKNEHENVLTNIRVVEDKRGNSYSRYMLQEWLDWCFSNGYSEAYVVNIKSPAISHVLDTLRNYKTEKVTNRQAPCDITSGPNIPEVAYKITP